MKLIDANKEQINVYKLDVHPLANVYRMNNEFEHNQLYESIKENGVKEPISITKENDIFYIIDGRNRLKAAKELSINFKEIPFRIIDTSRIPIAEYILLINNRRSNTVAEKALAIALLLPHGRKRGPKPKSGEDANCTTELYNFPTKVFIRKARYLVGKQPENPKYPDLVEEVRNGGSLNDAYKEAKKREKEIEVKNEKLKHLKDNDYDLFLNVTERGKDLIDQYNLMIQKEQDAIKNRRALYKICKNTKSLLLFCNETRRKELYNIVYTDFVEETGMDFNEWKEEIKEVINALNKILKGE